MSEKGSLRHRKDFGAQVLWRPDWNCQPLARVPLSHALAQLVLQCPYAKGDVCEITAGLLAICQSLLICYTHSSLGKSKCRIDERL